MIRKEKSRRRDSNPRPSRWQREALPTELLLHELSALFLLLYSFVLFPSNVEYYYLKQFKVKEEIRGN